MYTILAVFCFFAFYVVYCAIYPLINNPLFDLPGPPVTSWFTSHLPALLNPKVSPRAHDAIFKWDDHLLTINLVALPHIMKNFMIYQKPWQSRSIIDRLVGCGLLSAEGMVHKRQHRVCTAAFSRQNQHAFVPLALKQAEELRETLMNLIGGKDSAQIDICDWTNRATFNIICGFNYNSSAIKNDTDELLNACHDMFETATGGTLWQTFLYIYIPFPDNTTRIVKQCRDVIRHVASDIIREKKCRTVQEEKSVKANGATDLQEDQCISYEDILNNVNTFMFVGSDTSALHLSWTFLLLAQQQDVQTHLCKEILTVPVPFSDIATATTKELQLFYSAIASLPYLNNIIWESLQLIPPIHSLLCSDVDLHTIHICKGMFVHMLIEATNLSKFVWGEDAWEFKPDRWDCLPEAALQNPGVYLNTLTFSAGPRSCIGLHFVIIELRTFIYVLLSRFVFSLMDEKIVPSNV
ncbi:cytochrome P450 [Fistulina hepatica ATCC 64428]|uniref:Cytochrome P450 n=1 Tax=Fistulina hepatica ATCC 64428 TaxID=1128425 RepID=A0A0D7A379_9AGAR|nr:cytochrome P450 [Fistulina hepatica ATCC 64428]